MADFDNIRTRPSSPEFRKNFDQYFGKQDLPKGGKKNYSMEDLRKERELREKKAMGVANKKTAKKKAIKKKR